MSIFSVVLLTTVLGGEPDGSRNHIEETRSAISRAIPYVEERGAWWIEEKKCVSCHRVANMVWSLGAARQRGFPVSDRLDEWFDWAVDQSLAINPKEEIAGTTNKEGLAQLLLTAALLEATTVRNEAEQEFSRLIVEGQEADGSWSPGGQLPMQKRPQPETTDVTTMWLALALANHDGDDEGKRQSALDKAIQHLEARPPGESTEWYVTRLLLAASLQDEAKVDELQGVLLDQQQADGGWGWNVGQPSDSLGTGMSLYALVRAGVDVGQDGITRAQRFLIDTQREDGSWAVNGTKAKKKDEIAETAVYWGVTWALLGLVESLPH